ncbi:MAG: DUF1501 domain-containing protein [Gemmataceae bacterium]|nr:DUF1501 domain-containing protein [Gemmataceae bacterium]
MLHVLEGLSRRRWLQVGTLGLAGLSLPSLLRADSSARPARARSCVLLLLHGGPSQLDTFDMKPAAPAEVRGEFRPVSTTVPGVQVCEHLPRLSRVAHRFSIVRSMTHTAVNHNTATYFVTTGQPPPRDVIAFTPSENDFPHLGAQVAFGGRAHGDVPAAVSLPDPVSDGPYTTPGQNGGFLGARHAPFAIHGDPSDEQFSVEGLTSSPEMRPERIAGRRGLLRAVNERLGRLATDRHIEGLDGYQQRAFALLTSDSTRQAFELQRESARVRDRYGRHKYGQALLLARRLVEAGVRLVTVYWGGRVNNPLPHWDTHFNNNRRLRDELLPPFDQCFSAFLEDLHERGLLASTLVVCTGEFGRTPRFGQFTGNGVDDTGRDHWPQCYSLLVAGGNASGGRVLGRSDRFAAYPAEDPYTPQDVAATVLDALGVRPDAEVRDGFGRLVPLSTGQVRRALFVG